MLISTRMAVPLNQVAPKAKVVQVRPVSSIMMTIQQMPEILKIFPAACDSLRAVHYFTESLSKNAGPNTFKAVQCDSYDSFMNGKCNFCNASANANMGFLADPTKSGIFYLQTAEKFSRDELGILYYPSSFI